MTFKESEREKKRKKEKKKEKSKPKKANASARIKEDEKNTDHWFCLCSSIFYFLSLIRKDLSFPMSGVILDKVVSL